VSEAKLRIAAAQFAVFEARDWSAIASTLDRWVAEAADEGAELLVFPEYAAMLSAALLPPARRGVLAEELAIAAEHHPRWLDLHRELAARHRVHLLAGSGPAAHSGCIVNRALLVAPDGRYGAQDKQVMTRFETEHWQVAAGDGLVVFDTALGMIGVAICYDIEFPLIARALVTAGATLLLAPSCTDTTAGYWRVRLGAQARALESQCVVVQAPLVGEAPWCASVDVNVGAAGIYAPPDRGLPDDGVLAKGAWNTAQWVHAEVNTASLARVRADGQVLNHRDWVRQPGLGELPAVRVVRLRA